MTGDMESFTEIGDGPYGKRMNVIFSTELRTPEQHVADTCRGRQVRRAKVEGRDPAWRWRLGDSTDGQHGVSRHSV